MSVKSFDLRLLFVLTLVFVIGCSDGAAQNAVQSPTLPPVATQSGTLCGQIELPGRPLLYCYQDRANQAASSKAVVPVIYYFHGLGGDVDDLFDSNTDNRILEALTKLYGDQMPIVVSLSIGSQGILGEDTEAVAKVALPQVDQLVARGKGVRKIIMGGSMGGHNSLRLAAQVPEQFSAVAALCPAVATFNGHDQPAVDAYIQRHEPLLDRQFFEQALYVYRLQLPTAEIWERNNPYVLMNRGVLDRLPIYYSVGIEDQLGFIEGARAFRDRAVERGISFDYHEVHGPHCVFDMSALLRFLKANS